MRRSCSCPVIAVVLFSGLLFPAGARCADSETNIVLGFSAGLTNQTKITKLTKKPAKFDSFVDRLEFVHNNLQPSLQRYVEKIDTSMTGQSLGRLETPPSRFRVTSSMEYKDQSGDDLALNADFESEIELPNLEKRWKIFLRNTRDDVLPGLDASERARGTQIGVRNLSMWDKAHIRFDVGVHVTLKPVLFTRTEWAREWTIDDWVFQPKQRFFMRPMKVSGH